MTLSINAPKFGAIHVLQDPMDMLQVREYQTSKNEMNLIRFLYGKTQDAGVIIQNGYQVVLLPNADTAVFTNTGRPDLDNLLAATSNGKGKINDDAFSRIKTRLHDFVSHNRMEQAFEMLKAFYPDDQVITALSQRWKDVKSNSLMGILSSSEERTEHSKITMALLQFEPSQTVTPSHISPEKAQAAIEAAGERVNRIG